MEIQFNGENTKEIIDFCGEIIDGYWANDRVHEAPLSEALAFVTKDNTRLPLMPGDWVTEHDNRFYLIKKLSQFKSKEI